MKPTPVCAWYKVPAVSFTSAYFMNMIYMAGHDFGDELFDYYGPRDPSGIVALTEMSDVYPNIYAYQPWMARDWHPYGAFKHNGGQNSVFADGHAKWYSKLAYREAFYSRFYLKK